MYTRVYVNGSAYIRGISERKARMKTRVCWSVWYEMSDLFCWFIVICQWVLVWCMIELKLVEWVQSENMMKSGLQVVFYWRYWIQCENWWNVVHGGVEGCSLQSGGCSFLPREVVKREQGVVAPFQERLVNERRWVPAYWYESAPVHCCKMFSL